MKFREITLESGTKIFLGKNAENNDELVRKFKGKENVIMHTAIPGSAFCIIDLLKPLVSDLKKAAVFCAERSHDWRDNKQDVIVHVFTGKDVEKRGKMKVGTWRIKKKPKEILVKKQDIIKFLKQKNAGN